MGRVLARWSIGSRSVIRQVRPLVLAIFFLSTASAAVATDIDSRGSGNHYEIWTKRVSQTPLTSPARPANATRIEGRQAGGQVPRVRYEYRSPCDTGVGNPNTGAGVCPASPCPPGSVQYRQWQVAAGGETPLGFVCSSNGFTRRRRSCSRPTPGDGRDGAGCVPPCAGSGAAVAEPAG